MTYCDIEDFKKTGSAAPGGEKHPRGTQAGRPAARVRRDFKFAGAQGAARQQFGAGVAQLRGGGVAGVFGAGRRGG